MTLLQNIKNVYLTIKETSAPSNPDAGDQRVYIDPSDHKLKRKDSSGTVTTIESSASFSGTVLGTITTPPSAGWAWLNQGGASLTDNTTYQYLYMAAGTSGNNIRGVYRSFTPTARVSAIIRPVNPFNTNYGAGLFVRNSANSRLITYQFTSGAVGMSVDNWSSATSWVSGSTVSSTGSWSFSIPFYVGIKVDATNMLFQTSIIGDNVDANWQTANTTALASFIGAVDQIGFFIYTDNATYSEAAALLHWQIY